MLRLLIRYIKFLATSVAGSLIDTLVLWFMSSLVFHNGYWGEYVISPIISFQCAVIVNFLISYFYVWKDRTRSASGTFSFLKKYLSYNLSCSTVFLFRLGILLLIERFTGWNVVICNIVAMCFSGILNFIISHLIIFRKKS